MQAMTLAVPPQTRHVSKSIPPKAPTVGEYPLQTLGPGHRRMALNSRFLILDICSFRFATLAPLCRRHQRTVFAVRGEYTVKTCQIVSGLRHKNCQFGYEIHRLKDDVHGRTNAAGAGCAGAAKWVVPSRYGVFSSYRT